MADLTIIPEKQDTLRFVREQKPCAPQRLIAEPVRAFRDGTYLVKDDAGEPHIVRRHRKDDTFVAAGWITIR